MPEAAVAAAATTPAANGMLSTLGAATRRATTTSSELLGVAGSVGLSGVRGGGGVVMTGGVGPEVMLMELRDSENFRLCCPECGYDLLKVDVVDVLTQEQVSWSYTFSSFTTAR